jgi:CheY-like chemotaxis protein
MLSPSQSEQRPTATILVVEDEPALRRLLCICLRRRNYTVLTAKDGVEAMETFRQHRQIQLVVTDLMLPRMDGFTLKQQIAALRPEVKLLFMSGYAEQIVDDYPRLFEGSGFLEKPFLPEELVSKVIGLLAAAVAA